MDSPDAPRSFFARTQAAARAFRDLCLGASAVWLVLGVPTMLASAVEHGWGSEGLHVSELPEPEVPRLAGEAERERKRREDLDDFKLNQCFEAIDLGALKNTQRLACLHREHKRLQTILDTEAAKLRDSVDERGLAPLRASHRAWAAFRDRWCELDAIRNQAPTPEVNRLFCAVELTREYIVLIRKAA